MCRPNFFSSKQWGCWTWWFKLVFLNDLEWTNNQRVITIFPKMVLKIYLCILFCFHLVGIDITFDIKTSKNFQMYWEGTLLSIKTNVGWVSIINTIFKPILKLRIKGFHFRWELTLWKPIQYHKRLKFNTCVKYQINPKSNSHICISFLKFK
jgi:hypothetical protein